MSTRRVAIVNHCAVVNLLRIVNLLRRSLFSTAGSNGLGGADFRRKLQNLPIMCKWTRPFWGTDCRRSPKSLSSAQAASLCSAGIERARKAGLACCEMLPQYPQSAFQGFSKGRRGSAAVCDPNPPRLFARSSFSRNPLVPFSFQQTRVYPYPLVAGCARPNPKMGAPDPERSLFGRHLVGVWIGGVWNGHFPESEKYFSEAEISGKILEFPQKE